MSDSSSTIFADDLLKPETREELRYRLRHHASSSRHFETGHYHAGSYQSSDRSDGSTVSGSGSFISPMTREQKGTQSFYTAAQNQTPPAGQNRTSSPLWQNPHVRRGSLRGLGFCAFLLLCWMLWQISTKETAKTADGAIADTAATVPTDNPTPAPSEVAAANVASVFFSSIPQGAQVIVDGEVQSGKVTPLNLELPPGEHALELTKDGYHALSDTIQVQDQEGVQIFENYRLQKTVSMTQVVIFVESPNSVTIQVDDEITTNTNRVSRPMTPGFHRLRVSKAGYEPHEREFEVIEQAKQELAPIRLERETPVALPIRVTSNPPGARILAEGQSTGFVTPKELPAYFSKDDITVQLAGYRLREKKYAPGQKTGSLHFDLEQNIPTATTAMDYGFDLKPEENDSVVSVLHLLLEEDWNADPEKAQRDAKHQVAAWEQFTNFDPRLSHAHALLLWHHGKIEEAKDLLIEAEKRERERAGRKVPYYPLTRDKIRLETVTKDEEIAVEDLVDLMTDTALTLKNYPQDGLHQARKNAEFAGQLLGYLEGPVKERLTGAVNPRLIGVQIENSLPSDELRNVFNSARESVRKQYQDELDIAAAQIKARQEKEDALQKSGELGTRSIRGKDNRLNGRHDRVDYNAQTVTPFRIPTGPRFFATDGGLFGRPVFGGSYGPVGGYNFQNLIFTSGPAVSKTIFNKRTNDLTRFLRKEVKEELPSIQRRRPEALTTYMPQNLERKRRDLLRSVPTPTDE